MPSFGWNSAGFQIFNKSVLQMFYDGLFNPLPSGLAASGIEPQDCKSFFPQALRLLNSLLPPAEHCRLIHTPLPPKQFEGAVQSRCLISNQFFMFQQQKNRLLAR